MKCSSVKTIKVAFPQPHPAGNFYDLLLSGSSVPGEGDNYITRSNYSYHFLLSLQLSMPIFSRWLVCLFLV